ncbi:MAG TPA: MltA domain-containing protein [Allocoleopsis sp.]
MRKILTLLSLTLALSCTSNLPIFANGVLKLVNAGSTNNQQNDLLGWDDQLWGSMQKPGDKQALLQSIDYSLRYIDTPAAIRRYRKFSASGITRDRVKRSLIRFRQLLLTSQNPQELQAAVKREFQFYRTTGRDGKGSVLFTGYYQPVHEASKVETAEFRYPVYGVPPDFFRWRRPHPTRAQLEGRDGLQGDKGRLRGLEIAWLRDRLEAYVIHIEGSAVLQFTDGSTISISSAAATDYPYVSLGKELVRAGQAPKEGLTFPVLIKYFADKPRKLDNFITRNNRFVFFDIKNDLDARGSLSLPLTADRSVATDKSIMPPGALALIYAPLPFPNSQGKMEEKFVSRYVLDQDAGSAIKGAGRVDYFMGTGQSSEARASVTMGTGQFFYLLLKQ